MNPLHPKKLLLTKWTAVRPIARQKHFIVTKVIEPSEPEGAIEWIEIEAVHSRRTTRLPRRQLRDPTLWRQGWA
ncbi:MAG: TIGR02450 family Trp-rich protein [Betaproteobacteria bacterium]|nr:TIGR02450 family Trp-rich protein [Betaproteobacteria bacterium]